MYDRCTDALLKNVVHTGWAKLNGANAVSFVAAAAAAAEFICHESTF